MNNNSYNGWTNYATWRVNLEIFDGMEASQFSEDDCPNLHEIADQMKGYVQDFIDDTCHDHLRGGAILIGWLEAFLADVNWLEIARHKLEEYSIKYAA